MDKTEQHLNTLKWQDISIILTPNSEPILILICPSQQEAEKLYFLITKNPFRLTIHVDKANGTHELRIELTNSEFGIGFKTPKTLESYPPLKFLHNKQVNSITCGFYDNNQLSYNTNLHPLDSEQVNMN